MIRSVRRSTASLLAIALASALLTDCGGTNRHSLSKGQAEVFAHAVNLRTKDVPGMGILAPGLQNKNGPPFAGCSMRIPVADRVLSANSPRFLQSKGLRHFGDRVLVGFPPIQAVHSTVYVLSEPVLASNDVASVQNANIAACVQRTMIKESSGRLVDHEPYKREIHATPLSFPLAGLSGYSSSVPGFGLRVTETIPGAIYHQKHRQKLYEDTFGFALGPVEIVLHADGVARPFPAEAERHLLFVLYSRAVIQHV